MIKNSLTLKTTEISVHNLKGRKVPQNAVTYKVTEGTSAEKGDFKVETFFDSLENPVQIRSQYRKDGNITTLINNYSSDKKVVDSVLENNGTVTSESRRVIYPSLFVTTETNYPDKEYSVHKVGKLRKKHSPKSISYKTFWDGRKPDISYHNVDKKLDSEKGLELLPLLVSNSSENSINHLAKYCMRKENLEDIAPPVKTITIDELVKESKEAKDYLKINGKISGVTDPVSGQVFIIKNNDSNEELIDTVAHEYCHVKDFSDILRLEDNPKLAQTYFEMHSMQKEPIKSTDPEYKELKQMLTERAEYNSNCNAGNHDNMLIEQRAIKKGKEETNLYCKIIESVKQLLN